MQFLIGLICALLISGLAYYWRALSISGALAATLLGTIFFGLGGIPWAVLPVVFFVSSSLLSVFFTHRKASLGDTFEKSSRRDHWQVLANGGIAALLVMLQTLAPQSDWIWVAYCASFAAVNADTWATEVGVLSQSTPVLITTLKRVEHGTSGGVTWLGFGAAAGGALLIAVAASMFWQGNPPVSMLQNAIRCSVIVIAGVSGSLVDSLLGARLQGIYSCPSCNIETEHHPFHSCGEPTQLLRGLRWLNNDWVNTLCSISAAILGGLAGLFLF